MDTATLVTGGNHGTKWLGGLMAAASVLSSVDPSVVPPSWMPYVGGFIGLATLVRGFINTKNIQASQSQAGAK